jgi:hypothetical protein
MNDAQATVLLALVTGFVLGGIVVGVIVHAVHNATREDEIRAAVMEATAHLKRGRWLRPVG